MQNLYIHTPLIPSAKLGAITQKNIYLKCEALQPSGSFKDRGIGALCLHYAKENNKGFVCASGGNAGMSVAYVSNSLQIPAIIVIPQTTPKMIIQKLETLNAKVIVEGENWDASNIVAKKLAALEQFAYIPPFDHPLIWQGYMPLVLELQKDGVKPDAIILSVGGGGLYSGVVQGLHAIGWEDVIIIAAETQGTASFANCIKEKKWVSLSKIEGIAVTLGAKKICEKAYQLSQSHPTYSEKFTDKEAVKACLHFANDHRLLVEPACGATLAVLYNNRPILQQFNTIIAIVCGGSCVDLALLTQWKEQFGIT